MEFYPQVDPETGAFKSTKVRTWIQSRVTTQITEALEGFSGGGVESVSGTVTLDATGEPIREFFTTGTTIFQANGTTVSIEPDTAVVWRRAGSSWGYQQVVDGWITPTPTPDTTKPTAGTLASSNVSDKSFTLTVSGASDDRGLHTAPYRFSTDNGATWTAYQASNTLTITGKAPETTYTCKAEVRDAAGNTAQTASVTVTTLVEDTTLSITEDFDGTAGTSVSGMVTTTGGKTIEHSASAVNLVNAVPLVLSGDGSAILDPAQSTSVGAANIPHIPATPFKFTVDFSGHTGASVIRIGVSQAGSPGMALIYARSGGKVEVFQHGPWSKLVEPVHSVDAGSLSIVRTATGFSAYADDTLLHTMDAPMATGLHSVAVALQAGALTKVTGLSIQEV